MVVLVGPGGNVLNPVTGDSTCCDGEVKFIWCCVTSLQYAHRHNDVGLDNATFIDISQIVKLYPQGGGTLSSANIARFTGNLAVEVGGYSGWNVWDFGNDISDDIFNAAPSVTQPISIEGTIKHCGGDDSYLEVQMDTSIDIYVSDNTGTPIADGLIFDRWDATVHPTGGGGTWTTQPDSGGFKVIRQTSGAKPTAGDEVAFKAWYSHNTYRAHYSFAPCSYDDQAKYTSAGEIKCIRFDAVVEPAGVTPPSLTALTDCITNATDKAECGCECDQPTELLIDHVCECEGGETTDPATRTDPRNTEKMGQVKESFTAAGDLITDGSTDWTIVFEVLTAFAALANGDKIYWSGTCNDLGAILTLQGFGGNLRVEYEYTDTSPGAATAVVSLSLGHVVHDEWNKITIDWDSASTTLQISIYNETNGTKGNGVAPDTASKKVVTDWGSSSAPDIGILGGWINNTNNPIKGCFYGYDVT